MRRIGFAAVASCVLALAGLVSLARAGDADRVATAVAPADWMYPTTGTVTLTFDDNVLDSLNWQIAATGTSGDGRDRGGITLSILPSEGFIVDGSQPSALSSMAGQLLTRGALRLGASGRLIHIGNLSLVADGSRSLSLINLLDETAKSNPVFYISDVVVDPNAPGNEIRMTGVLSVGHAWAKAVGQAEAGGVIVGRFDVRGSMESVESIEALSVTADDTEVSASDVSAPAVGSLAAQTNPGPDVIVGDLHQVNSYGSIGDIAAFSVGTVSCNIGTVRLNWLATNNQHPVIGQNMYRLKDGRVEQIGQSWLKHGFFAVSDNLCSGPNGCNGDATGTHLGVGCSDPYSANLNGQAFNLGPRFEVNASTGFFEYPFSGDPPEDVIGRRLQVHHRDLDPTMNIGVSYFVEAQYVTPDDADAGNNNNNNSYRQVIVGGNGDGFTITLTGSTQREQPAIRIWQANDPEVFEVGVEAPGDGLFIVAGKATALGNQMWHYEYAVQNINSNQSGQAFEVPISPFAVVENVGFHDVDYHSGEPFDGTDWVGTLAGGRVVWSTDDFATNENANALRWGTLYNFWFDSNSPPQPSEVTIGLFKPGLDSEVTVASIGPVPVLSDCNGNGIDDLCDISCGEESADCNVPGCGSGGDCTDNGILDECEPDCAGDGVADTCAILSGASTDCNLNELPDDCEFVDCNGNTIVDSCDILTGVDPDCAGGPLGDASAGFDVYNTRCSACHGINGIGDIAPKIRERSRVDLWTELLAPSLHTGGLFPDFTQQDFADLEAFLTSEGSRGRPDLIPDSCQTLADCGGTSESDACELESGAQIDVDYDGVPDQCSQASAPFPSIIPTNRYFAFVAVNESQAGIGPVRQAIRVTSPDFPFMLKWIGPPDENDLARLQCDVHYREWIDRFIYVSDRDIVPGASYSLQAVLEGIDLADEFRFSQPPVAITTHDLWGDVVGEVNPDDFLWTWPNSVVNVNDVVAMLQNLTLNENAPHFSRVDIAGEVPNGFVNATDLQHVLLAFKMGPYPFGQPEPCP